MKYYSDTNILVRLATNDIPHITEELSDRLKQISKNQIIVLDAVLAEFVFVLEKNSSYTFNRRAITSLYHALSKLGYFSFPVTSDESFKAYLKYPKLHFVDCLLLAQSQAGYKVLTLDKDLIKAIA